VSQT